MGQALYRKYRSKSLDEIIGQEHITTTLKNAFKQGKISHAYLFTGPRGVGKTSIARIVAFEINGLPYDETATHLDIIEIDAASNRRIDEIRDLRDKVNNAPSSAKYKVYIIDEVHMLTREAFNALLKTLEEPPAHAVFILATTESHKLPDTIISRTQRFTFKPVSVEAAVGHLKTIAQKEHIKIDDDALELIAVHGQGSFRDSIGLLDQMSSVGDSIGLIDVQRSLGIAPQESIQKIIQNLVSKDPASLLADLTALRLQGFQATQISQQVASAIRQDILADKPTAMFELLKPLLEVPASFDPDTALELVLLNVAYQPQITPASVMTTAQPVAASTLAVVAEPATKETATKIPVAKESSVAKKAPATETLVTKAAAATHEPQAVKKETMSITPATVNSTIDFDVQAWDQVLATIKQRHNTLYSVARMADVRVEDNKLHLQFNFAFHKKKINDAQNRLIIADIIKKLTGEDVEITCTVTTKPTSTKAAVAVPNSVSIDAIANIFGGAEVID